MKITTIVKKLDGMLVATFLTMLFYSSTYPYIHKILMEAITNQLLALENIVTCASVIVIGQLWNKFSDSGKLFRFYPLICIVEMIANISTCVFVITTHALIAYFILDMIVFAIITRNIICGGVRLKAIRYNSEKKRERFDNNNNACSSAATIIGSVIAMVLNLDFNIMICLSTFGNIIDNVFYICIYHNTVKKDK